MSGIINSAGSRSGVIGTTELDYEEGTSVFAYEGSTTTGTVGGGNQTGYYVRVGNMVTVQCNLYYSSASGTWAGNWLVTGFPFEAKNYYIVTVKTNNFDTDDAPQVGFLHTLQTYMEMYKNNTSDARSSQDTRIDISQMEAYDHMYFTCTYQTNEF